MPKKRQDTELEYLFASSNIKALENNLLNMSGYDKLIDADGIEEIVRILAAQGYATGVFSTDDPVYMNRLISYERKNLYAKLEDIAPNIDFFKFFLYSYDYLNLKALIKNAITGSNREIRSESGSIPYEVLKKAVQSKQYDALTENMKNGVVEAENDYALTRDPQKIDIVLDRYCFADMLEAAKSSGIDYLTGYVRESIDIANVKSYLRLKAIGKPEEFADTVFVPGGTRDADSFSKGYRLKTEEFAETLKGDKMYELVSKGLALTKQSGGMGKIEQMCDDALMKYVAGAKYIPFGAQVVAGYIIAKETEFKNIRIITAGKAAGLDAERIKERLREPYV